MLLFLRVTNAIFQVMTLQPGRGACELETVQDFLIKLGIKPFMHTLFHRQTYLNYDQTTWSFQSSDFQSHFSIRKIDGTFQRKILD